jgi:hypothetical protein
MQICDLCWNQKRDVAKAVEEIVVDHQVFHLCDKHKQEVCGYLSKEDGRRKDSPTASNRRAS